jgi:ornithine cyclodeaminase/alanine dehydrogenase-like protein (mu-crystallin family)
MARNLQTKLPSTDTLRIYDINQESVTRFADEAKTTPSGAAVQAASSVREAAEDSVSPPPRFYTFQRFRVLPLM